MRLQARHGSAFAISGRRCAASRPRAYCRWTSRRRAARSFRALYRLQAVRLAPCRLRAEPGHAEAAASRAPRALIGCGPNAARFGSREPRAARFLAAACFAWRYASV
jgi:hypothetical protein